MCITAGGASVLPTFGAEGRLGANPISIAAPAKTEAPLLFDAATSAVALNKLELARRVGSDLLPGWIADVDGSPVLEETAPRGEGASSSVCPSAAPGSRVPTRATAST